VSFFLGAALRMQNRGAAAHHGRQGDEQAAVFGFRKVSLLMSPISLSFFSSVSLSVPTFRSWQAIVRCVLILPTYPFLSQTRMIVRIFLLDSRFSAPPLPFPPLELLFPSFFLSSLFSEFERATQAGRRLAYSFLLSTGSISSFPKPLKCA